MSSQPILFSNYSVTELTVFNVKGRLKMQDLTITDLTLMDQLAWVEIDEPDIDGPQQSTSVNNCKL